MKFLGHPIHVLLIHFPTALLPADAVLSIISYWKQDPLFAQAGFFCAIGGVILGYLAIITGLIDLIVVSKENKPATGRAFTHGMINGSIILIYTVFVYKAFKVYPIIAVPTMTWLLIKSILIIVLFVGNFLGGKLIYTYHVGINDTKQNG